MTVDYLLAHPLVLLLAVLAAVGGAGRLTRVVSYDDYPPSKAFRSWWVTKVTKGNGWAKLADCFWCQSPWWMALCLLWGLVITPLSPIALVAWWVFWGWLALSYATAILIARDEP